MLFRSVGLIQIALISLSNGSIPGARSSTYSKSLNCRGYQNGGAPLLALEIHGLPQGRFPSLGGAKVKATTRIKGPTTIQGFRLVYSGFVNTRVCLGGLRDVIDLKGLGP